VRGRHGAVAAALATAALLAPPLEFFLVEAPQVQAKVQVDAIFRLRKTGIWTNVRSRMCADVKTMVARCAP